VEWRTVPSASEGQGDSIFISFAITAATSKLADPIVSAHLSISFVRDSASSAPLSLMYLATRSRTAPSDCMQQALVAHGPVSLEEFDPKHLPRTSLTVDPPRDEPVPLPCVIVKFDQGFRPVAPWDSVKQVNNRISLGFRLGTHFFPSQDCPAGSLTYMLVVPRCRRCGPLPFVNDRTTISILRGRRRC
jgi:hypothetical protein